MTAEKTGPQPESPAHRLGVLYGTSFLLIAILSGFAQFLILQELGIQSHLATSVVELVSEDSLDRPLSFAALAALAETAPDKRKPLVESLSKTLEKRHATSLDIATLFRRMVEAEGQYSEPAQLIARADSHRAAASQSAEQLLSLLQAEVPGQPRSADTGPLLQRLLEDENIAADSISQAIRAAEGGSLTAFTRLEQYEFAMFGLVLIVLVVEGLFVVNPAVRRIQRFMSEMEQSNRELKSYAHRLERSNNELQDFASVASHDLQEPLRKIQAFSDRLRYRAADSLDTQSRDYLDRVQNAASRMQSLINDLLTYARIATKAQPFVPTDLTSVAKEVVSDLEARIEQVQGSVEIGELPKLEADPVQFRQLMQNLIGNALKYKRPDVPPVVKVFGLAAGSKDALDSTTRFSDFCQIVVEDNGIGFEQVYAEKIFTIFQRLHGRTEYEGTGVGLAVCRKIVERHGGTITANSTPGVGSRFTVTLPIRQSKENSLNGHAA